MAITAYYLPLTTFLLGLFVGSFANVVILRLHSKRGEIFSGRSECPKCKHVLGVWDLIPLFSWIFLKEKCRYCHANISAQYPLVELLMGLAWLLVAGMMPIDIATSTWQEWTHLTLMLFIISSLTIIAIYDLKYMEIPDQISLPTIGFLAVSLPFSFTPMWHDALLGAGIAFGFFALQILISRGAWMGGGDLRLGVIMGLLLGWKLTVLALFIAYLCGSLMGIGLIATGKKSLTSQMPFGPFLVLGTITALFWGREIIASYERLMGLLV